MRLRRLLTPLRGRFPAEDVATLAEAEARLERQPADVVIVGTPAIDTDTAELLRALQGLAPDAALLVLTDEPPAANDDGPLAIVLACAHEHDVREDLDAPGLLRAIRYALERKRREQDLLNRANVDPLTGLPNRSGFVAALGRAMARSRRTGLPFTVMFVDLDRFKAVNDTFGHAAGDQLLCHVAGRLQRSLRDGDTVARLGGDELVVLAQALLTDEDAAIVAGRLCTAASAPFEVDGREVSISASVGIALYPADAAEPEALLLRADEAMYRAKRSGGNGYEFAAPERAGRLPTRLAMETNLRRALSLREFTLHYQPLVDASTGAVHKLEALLRWQRDATSLTPPDTFVPLLEETGLILPVGEWVLRTACADVATLRAAGHRLHVAVNVSARQLRAADFARTVANILEETGLPPEALELELTESILIEHTETQRDNLRALRAMGVTLALDDFGTGYSSLSYLRQLPLNTLKIDRSFIGDVGRDPKARAIGKSIVALAHALELRVVAEGVETAEQLAFCAQNGCDLIQGFHVSRPMALADARVWLESRLRLVA